MMTLNSECEECSGLGTAACSVCPNGSGDGMRRTGTKPLVHLHVRKSASPQPVAAVDEGVVGAAA